MTAQQHWLAKNYPKRFHQVSMNYILEGSVSISTCNEHNYVLLQQF